MRALRGRPELRIALGAIGGPQEQASSAILSLGLGLSVLAAVGQIDGNLRGAIARDLPDVAPSYFFVDIQSDQLTGFKARLADDPAVSRVDTAPMLRGVISKINNRPAKEVAGDHWVLQGDRGVTYSQTAADGVTITQGSWWPADHTGAPQISFAAEEAEEMGLVLGDTMTINILGRDITGTITSFREVDFSTAGIGFILTMNPAALQGAPHSHIATVYATPEAEAKILRDLAGTFPNITAIRVADAIARVGELLASLAAATSLGASATLITGFLVLIGAAAAGVEARTFEAAVLKTLGASKGVILRSFALRAGLLGAAAGTIALIAGLIFAWAVSTFIMETSFAIVWGNALAIVLGGIGATMVAFLGYARGPLKARPAGILRGGN
jgi:putative ABC transport system permease protein